MAITEFGETYYYNCCNRSTPTNNKSNLDKLKMIQTLEAYLLNN